MSKMSLAVERATHHTVITGPADLRDQKWLDEQVGLLRDGVGAARDIWDNWSANRTVGRLHPGQSAGEYIEGLGLRLSLAEAMAALPDGSTRQVAAVAGVSNWKVATERAAVRNLTPYDPPTRVIGADGKSYPGRVIRGVAAEVIEPIQPAGATNAAPATHESSLVGANTTTSPAPTLADELAKALDALRLLAAVPVPEPSAESVRQYGRSLNAQAMAYALAVPPRNRARIVRDLQLIAFVQHYLRRMDQEVRDAKAEEKRAAGRAVVLAGNNAKLPAELAAKAAEALVRGHDDLHARLLQVADDLLAERITPAEARTIQHKVHMEMWTTAAGTSA